jgi:hypothetical protein
VCCPKYNLENICPPSVSHGEDNTKNSDVISQHQKCSKHTKKVINDKSVVLDLYQKGYTQKVISEKFGVSQPRISKIIRRFNSGVKKERFHNFSVTFQANVPFDTIDLKDIKLRGTSYKNWNSVDFHIQIFKDSVLVRYNKDVIGKKIVASEEEAINRIKAFITEWNVYNIQFMEYKISSGHNEFMDSPIAKNLAVKNETMIYKDKIDGKDRTIIDFSPSKDNPSGAPNFEHVHPKYFKPDSEKWEEIIDDVATGNYEPLHVTKNKMEVCVNVLSETNNTLGKLNNSIGWLDKNIVSHTNVLSGISNGVSKDTDIREQQTKVLGNIDKSIQTLAFQYNVLPNLIIKKIQRHIVIVCLVFVVSIIIVGVIYLH